MNCKKIVVIKLVFIDNISKAHIYLFIYILEISPASRDIISSVIHVGVLGVVDVLVVVEIFSVHIHLIYAQIKSFGWGGVFDPLHPYSF